MSAEGAVDGVAQLLKAAAQPDRRNCRRPAIAGILGGLANFNWRQGITEKPEARSLRPAANQVTGRRGQVGAYQTHGLLPPPAHGIAGNDKRCPPRNSKDLTWQRQVFGGKTGHGCPRRGRLCRRQRGAASFAFSRRFAWAMQATSSGLRSRVRSAKEVCLNTVRHGNCWDGEPAPVRGRVGCGESSPHVTIVGLGRCWPRTGTSHTAAGRWSYV